MFLYLYTQTEEETLMGKDVIRSQEWSLFMEKILKQLMMY